MRGFELGVNVVHTAPDYEGVDAIVARAIRESGRTVHVLPQAYDVHYNTKGRVENFERLFEDALRTYGVDRFPLFGIACLDDREAYQENVWGTGGMVEFLLRKKSEGVIGGLYCTTHGGPDFVLRALEADVFDALMIAYNPLGFHLLSFSPPEGRSFENMKATKEQIFPAAAARDVGIIVMKPLAGGLLCDSRAFPPRAPLSPEHGQGARHRRVAFDPRRPVRGLCHARHGVGRRSRGERARRAFAAGRGARARRGHPRARRSLARQRVQPLRRVRRFVQPGAAHLMAVSRRLRQHPTLGNVRDVGRRRVLQPASEAGVDLRTCPAVTCACRTASTFPPASSNCTPK